MPAEYEWDIETYDEHGDIDHDHRSELSRYPAAVLAEALSRGSLSRLVLVRDVPRAWGHISRTWAYVEDGALPDYFSSDRGETGTRVPRRYKRELSRRGE